MSNNNNNYKVAEAANNPARHRRDGLDSAISGAVALRNPVILRTVLQQYPVQQRAEYTFATLLNALHRKDVRGAVTAELLRTAIDVGMPVKGADLSAALSWADDGDKWSSALFAALKAQHPEEVVKTSASDAMDLVDKSTVKNQTLAAILRRETGRATVDLAACSAALRKATDEAVEARVMPDLRAPLQAVKQMLKAVMAAKTLAEVPAGKDEEDDDDEASPANAPDADKAATWSKRSVAEIQQAGWTVGDEDGTDADDGQFRAEEAAQYVKKYVQDRAAPPEGMWGSEAIDALEERLEKDVAERMQAAMPQCSGMVKEKLRSGGYRNSHLVVAAVKAAVEKTKAEAVAVGAAAAEPFVAWLKGITAPQREEAGLKKGAANAERASCFKEMADTLAAQPQLRDLITANFATNVAEAEAEGKKFIAWLKRQKLSALPKSQVYQTIQHHVPGMYTKGAGGTVLHEDKMRSYMRGIMFQLGSALSLPYGPGTEPLAKCGKYNFSAAELKTFFTPAQLAAHEALLAKNVDQLRAWLTKELQQKVGGGSRTRNAARRPARHTRRRYA